MADVPVMNISVPQLPWGPTPINIEVTLVKGSSGEPGFLVLALVMRGGTAQGYSLPPEMAEWLGNMLIKNAREAASSLIVPEIRLNGDGRLPG